MSVDSNLDSYYFHQGTNYESYNFLGCISSKINDLYTYTFRVWAPNAYAVGLISEFSGWETSLPFYKISENGIWELKYESAYSLERKAYKFQIVSASGTVNKGDPYARFSRGLDDGASLIFTQSDFEWSDSAWVRHREKTITTTDGSYISAPINIYEIHLGSFMRHDDNTFLSYKEAADIIGPYAKSMGFTHIELLPIAEYPFDGSWGYQVGAFYAPTSRFGDPDDFRYFVNKMHCLGLGVIIDWVPAHFPKDEWGLYEFDGQPLYEYQGNDRKESRSWGTRFFDLGREEVQSFLISNAVYFLSEFHIDGLRVDAVASMLYLDYDRDPGEWIPNQFGSNLNLEAVAFFKKLNSVVFARFPNALMIAEESTSYGNLTRSVDDGGLGFNMKWNMGWANDFYKYVSTDPVYRKYDHKALNFPIMYAFSENFCMPISHDEVVHGKKSFIDKMFGNYEDKFSQMRASLLLMMTYPGKKLMFMGTEYAQFREWDYDNSLEWFMLDYPLHKSMHEYVGSLNEFYLRNSELWSIDFDPRGFSWILADESDKNTVAYRRWNNDGNSLIVVINFSGDMQTVTIPLINNATNITPVFVTELGNENVSISVTKGREGYTACLTLPKFFGIVLKEKNKNIRVKLKGVGHVL